MVFTPESRLLNLDVASVSSPTPIRGALDQFHDFLEDRPPAPPEHPGYAPKSLMKLRTRLNLVLTGLTAVFVLVLVLDALRATRSSVREEIEAANRVAAHLLGRLALSYADAGGTPAVQHLLEQLGHVRSNDITLRGADGTTLYRSPAAAYKAGRVAPAWFAQLLNPHPARQLFALPDGAQLAIDAEPSRAILDAWDDLTRLIAIAAVLLVAVSALAFWLVERALAPFPVIVHGLQRLRTWRTRLPPARARRRRGARDRRRLQPHGAERAGQAGRRARRARGAHAPRRTPRARTADRAARRGGAPPDRARAAR